MWTRYLLPERKGGGGIVVTAENCEDYKDTYIHTHPHPQVKLRVG